MCPSREILQPTQTLDFILTSNNGIIRVVVKFIANNLSSLYGFSSVNQYIGSEFSRFSFVVLSASSMLCLYETNVYVIHGQIKILILILLGPLYANRILCGRVEEKLD